MDNCETYDDQDYIRAKKIDKDTVVVLTLISSLQFYSNPLF
jgi:hypothetical protein